MVSRIASVLVLTGTIMLGLLGSMPAHALTGSVAVPELEPSVLTGGIALLIGGIVMLNERRRKNR